MEMNIVITVFNIEDDFPAVIGNTIAKKSPNKEGKKAIFTKQSFQK